jgi:hypothetical protein
MYYGVSIILRVGVSVLVEEFDFENGNLISLLMDLFVQNSLKTVYVQKLNYICFFKHLFTWLTYFCINLYKWFLSQTFSLSSIVYMN